MCGLFGWQIKNGYLTDWQMGILSYHLSLANDVRGGDSWGFVVPSGSQNEIVRGLGDISDSAYKMIGQNCVMAHTRYKTMGAVNIKNCHPFEIGRIIGSHNGMIYNHKEKNEHYERDFEVDSMHLFAHLNEDLPFDDLEGYGVIQWIQKNQSNIVYFTKLNKGEISIFGLGTPKNTKGVFWSSSESHLKEALKVAGISKKEYFPYIVKEGPVYFSKNGQLFVEENRILKLAEEPKTYYTYNNEDVNEYGWSDHFNHQKYQKYFQKNELSNGNKYNGKVYDAGLPEDSVIDEHSGFDDAWNEYCMKKEEEDLEKDLKEMQEEEEFKQALILSKQIG